MSFLPVGPCCFKGLNLAGDPRGVMEQPEGSRTVRRYHATPKNGEIVDPKAAMILFYDAFGFDIPNPKIMADLFADRLKLNVFVPDYIPNPAPASLLDQVIEHSPGSRANVSWFTSIKQWGSTIPRMIPYMRGLLLSSCMPPAIKACEELRAEGYTSLGAIGYCRGGTIIVSLLSERGPPSHPGGASSLLDCGVICHPGPEKTEIWEKITKPTAWHLADHDVRFKDKDIEELKEVLHGDTKKSHGQVAEIHVYPQTVHGFAARPDLSHEPTKEAFNKANDDAITFFQKHLVGQ